MPASLKARIVAFLYDYLLFLAYATLLAIISSSLKPSIPFVFEFLFMTSPLISEISALFLVTLPLVFYFAISESSRKQASWGKKKKGIRVTDGRGNRISFGRSLVRSAVKFLPWELGHFVVWRMVRPTELTDAFIYSVLVIVYALVLVYFILLLVNKRRKSIYDWVAGTEVRCQEPRIEQLHN